MLLPFSYKYAHAWNGQRGSHLDNFMNNSFDLPLTHPNIYNNYQIADHHKKYVEM